VTQLSNSLLGNLIEVCFATESATTTSETYTIPAGFVWPEPEEWFPAPPPPARHPPFGSSGLTLSRVPHQGGSLEEWVDLRSQLIGHSNHVAAVPECRPWDVVSCRVGTEEDVVVPDDALRVGHMLTEPEAHRFARIPVLDDPRVVEDLGVPALGRVSTEGRQHTANTRTCAFGFLRRISFCTQLAPWWQTLQVGEKSTTSRSPLRSG